MRLLRVVGVLSAFAVGVSIASADWRPCNTCVLSLSHCAVDPPCWSADGHCVIYGQGPPHQGHQYRYIEYVPKKVLACASSGTDKIECHQANQVVCGTTYYQFHGPPLWTCSTTYCQLDLTTASCDDSRPNPALDCDS